MLIVSAFRDYYDSIKVYGIDKTVVYNRKIEKMDFKKGPRMYSIGFFQKEPFQGTRIIGFCGKLYPLLQKNNVIIYDKKHALSSIKENYYSREVSECFGEALTNPQLLKIFTQYKVPVFIYGDYLDGKYTRGESKQLILNPKLKDWGFQSVQDPVTAFQNIYMYISGVIGIPESPMVKINDKEMAKKKGHDSPYSFRKPPGKRGKKQWR